MIEARNLPADLVLHHGAHDGPDDPDRPTGCLLEIASWAAGEPWSDSPACVSPVAAALGRSLNDGLGDTRRQELLPLVPRLVGTAGDGRDHARAMMALDWLIRIWTPAWLDLAGLAEAAELRGLRQIVDLVSAQSAGPVVRRARERAAAAWEASVAAAGPPARPSPAAAALDAAWEAAGAAAWGAAAGAAARDAAGAAARAAAVAAAWEAAWDAARAAAAAAAWEAARAAGWDAAWEAVVAAGWDVNGVVPVAAAAAAAWDAAGAVLAPTVDQMQTSAIALLRALTRP